MAGGPPGGNEHRVTGVNLITATRLSGIPAQRFGFLLSRSPQWMSEMFDEPALEAYFKAFNFLHSARWISLGRFPHLEPDQPKEARMTRWVLFMANFDGDWDAYFSTFMQAMGEGVYDIWGRSVGYPGFPAAGTAYRLEDWLNTRIVPSEHYYAAYPHATANDVRASSRVCREVLSAALDLRREGVDPGREVGPRFDDLARRVRQCLGPVGCPPAGWRCPPTSAQGSIEGVAAVFPLLPGREDDARVAISSWGSGANSPFFGVPGVHFARAAVIDRHQAGRYPGAGGELTQVETLHSSYLLVGADYDGEGDARAASDGFFTTLFEVGRDAVEAVWVHCRGFEGINDGAAFADLAWRCHRPVLREYLDYRDESVRSVLAALEGHPRFVDLVERRSRGEPVTAGDLLAWLD